MPEHEDDKIEETAATVPTETRSRGLRDAGGLFLGLKGRGADVTLDAASAVMIPMVAAMLSDGRIEEDELAHIDSICAASPIFERNSATENSALVMRSMKLIDDHGVDVMCQRAASILSPALRETAFTFAVRTVFSDGYVGRLEREIIEQMIQWLGVEQERARMIVDVVSIMNHPPSA